MEKTLNDTKREIKQVDYDIQRLQGDGQRGKLILPRLAEKNLNRIHDGRAIAPKGFGAMNGRYGGIRNIQQKSSVSASLDFSAGRHHRMHSIQTPASQFERQGEIGLDKYLENPVPSVSKSLVVGDASMGKGDYSSKRYASLVPRSVNARSYGMNKDINAANLTIIPPPTSVT